MIEFLHLFNVIISNFMIDFSDDFSEQEIQQRAMQFMRYFDEGESCYFDVCDIERIVEHFNLNAEWAWSRRLIEFGLRLHPDSIDMKWCAAPVIADNGDYHRALKLLKEIEHVESTNEELQILKASVYGKLNRHRDAVACYRKALSMNPDFKDHILVDLSMALSKLGEHQGALKALHAALKDNPKNAAALNEIGYCYDALDRQEDLIQFYETFLDAHPYAAQAWFNLGMALVRNDELEKSLRAFDFCLVIDEEFTPANYNKANALIQLERYQEAIEEFETMMAIEGVQSHLLCFIGECFEKMDQPGPARVHYQHALELDERCAEAYIGLAVLLDVEDRSEESMEYYRKAIDIDSESAGYWHMYALAAERAGHYKTSERAFRTAIRLDKHRPEIWEDYAQFKATCGDLQAAVDLLTEGYQCNEDASELLYLKAYFNSQRDSRADAQDLLSLAAQRDPEGLRRFLKERPEVLSSPLMIDFMASGNFEK